MKNTTKYQALRARAEQLLKEKGVQASQEHYQDIEKLVEELNVHQIELEMQNQELQRTTERLEAESRKYKTLYHEAPIAYLTINATGNIVDINQAAAELFGRSVQSFRLTSIFPYLTDASKPKFVALFKQIFSSRQLEFGDIDFLTKIGQVMHTRVNAQAYFDHDWQTHLCRLTLTDISADKRREAELARSSRQNERLFTAAADMLGLKDEAAMYAYLTKHLSEFYPNAAIALLRVVPEHADGPRMAEMMNIEGVDAGVLVKASRLLGSPILGRRFPVVARDEKLAEHGKLVEYAGEVVDFFKDSLPAEASIALEALLGFTGIYSIGIRNQGVLHGFLYLFTRRNQAIDDGGFLETYVQQAGLILSQVKAEQALQASEARFRAIFEQAAAGMAIAVSDDHILDVNTTLCQMLGYSRDELLRLTVADITLPDDRAREMAYVAEVLDRRQDAFNIEKRYRHKDGHLIWGNLSSNVVRDAAGNIDFVIGVVVDITARKKAEHALQAIVDLYAVMEQSPLEHLLHDGLEAGVQVTESAIGYLHFVNPDQETISLELWTEATMQQCTTVERVSHYPISEAGVWVDCVRQRRPVIHNDYAQIPIKKGLPHGHVPLTRHMSVPVFAAGRIAAILGVGNKPSEYTAIDSEILSLLAGNIWSIYQRKTAEQALQAAERDWRDSFNSLEDVMLVIDTDFRIENINQSGLDLLGLSRDAVVGKSCYEVMHQADQPHELCPLLKSLNSQAAASAEWYAPRFDRYFSIKSSPVVNDQGEIVKFVDLMRDITDLKVMQQKLQEANATKDTFFSILAHDLKNAFFGFQSGAALLAERFQDSDDAMMRDIAVEIHKRAGRVYELLEQLLTWARSQQGTIPYEPMPMSLHALARRAMELVRDQSEGKHLTIQCLVREDAQVQADMQMVDTVLRNLLANAIKFTDEGGTITVDAADAGAMVAVSVSDTGVGMPDAKRQRLFRLGERNISSAGTAGEHGTGLGLILCKEFIDKHGGKIWIDSAEGQGSTVTFTLPKTAPLP